MCKLVFCQQHYKPVESNTDNDHLCLEFHKAIDRKAITCPVCSQVVPVNRDQDPNVAVDLHLRKNCPKEKGSSSPSFNKCGIKGCNKKEIILVTCDKCLGKYCIRHRLEIDHKCQGKSIGKSSLNKNDCIIS